MARLHELFRKVCANFCPRPCDTSQEPDRYFSDELVHLNFFILGELFWVDFPSLIEGGPRIPFSDLFGVAGSARLQIHSYGMFLFLQKKGELAELAYFGWSSNYFDQFQQIVCLGVVLRHGLCEIFFFHLVLTIFTSAHPILANFAQFSLVLVSSSRGLSQFKHFLSILVCLRKSYLTKMSKYLDNKMGKQHLMAPFLANIGESLNNSHPPREDPAKHAIPSFAKIYLCLSDKTLSCTVPLLFSWLKQRILICHGCGETGMRTLYCS